MDEIFFQKGGILLDTLTETLNKLLKEKNIKAITLSKAINVSNASVSRILNGTQVPTIETLYKMAQYFEVTMEYIITGQNNYTNENFTDDEKHLIECYRIITNIEKENLLTLAEAGANRKRKGKLSCSEESNTA